MYNPPTTHILLLRIFSILPFECLNGSFMASCHRLYMPLVKRRLEKPRSYHEYVCNVTDTEEPRADDRLAVKRTPVYTITSPQVVAVGKFHCTHKNFRILYFSGDLSREIGNRICSSCLNQITYVLYSYMCWSKVKRLCS